MIATHQVYIALGSNRGQPIRQLSLALNRIKQHPQFSVQDCSNFYLSRPLGRSTQYYVNAAIAATTPLSPINSLDALQQLEFELGRNRAHSSQWGPRCIDLDMIKYDEIVVDSSRLRLPHREASKRNFVLWPLRDIAPEITLIDNQPLSALIASVSKDGLVRVPTALINLITSLPS